MADFFGGFGGGCAIPRSTPCHKQAGRKCASLISADMVLKAHNTTPGAAEAITKEHRIIPEFVDLSPASRPVWPSTRTNAAAIIVDDDPKYGADGGNASRVAIVAGVHGSRKYTRNGHLIDKHSPLSDAAGVYVVEKGDPQDFLAATRLELGDDADGRPSIVGRLANPVWAILDDIFGDEPGLAARIDKNADKAKSHVTTYADTIQLVARNGGINLYAGGVDANLSTGCDNKTFAGVNLIYGNQVEYERSDSPYSLQPLVKGHSLETALFDVSQMIEGNNGAIFDLQTQITELKAALATHFHTLGAPPMTATALQIPGLAGGPIPVSGVTGPSLPLAGYLGQSARHDAKAILAAVTRAINSFIAEFNRSDATTGTFKSRWNKTN